MAPLVVFVSLFAFATSMTTGDWSPSGSVSSFSHHEDLSEYSTTAYVNVTYVDPVTGRTIREKSESGKFGESHIGFASGVLVHVLSGPDNSGCSLPFRTTSGTGELPQEPWVALVRRGGCNFQVKVDNAYQSNASGVIVYNDRESDELEKMRLSLRGKRRPLAAVFTSRDKGTQLAALLDAGTRVSVELTVARHCAERLTVNRFRPSKYQPGPFMRDLCGWNMPYYECAMLTSVLFVSISFVVLMLISLAWLVFYYVQRFRYIHAKDRLSRRLCSAAKKALSKIPTKHIKHEDKEVQGEGECCAICIEPYRTSEVVRILPCRHEFHRSCIDPWLVEHRTCPMCKMDILKHYGFVFTGSQESILHMDIEEVVSVSESESLRRQRSRSLSPAPLPFTRQTPQLQLSLNEEGQMSRSSSPNELTPSLPPLTPRPASVSHTVCVDDPIAPNAGLRRSLSLDDCS